MKYIGKAVLPILALCMVLSACAQSPAAETPVSTPPAYESAKAVETERSVSSEAALISDVTPLPLPEGSPLTLAGEELYSAVMDDIPNGEYSFFMGTAANLEGWFQLMGFRAEEPFYEYYDPDGALRLRLWYDEESGMGLGIRYRDYGDSSNPLLYGFGFMTTGWADRDPEGEKYGFGWYRWEDPYALPKGDFEEMMDYEERREYDETGRMTGLASYGVFEEWSAEIEQPMRIYSMEYEYDEETGVLVHRRFNHDYRLAATTNPGMDGYYDSRGRLAYEYGYITHGSTDTYYIYEGDSGKPSYTLCLDDNMGLNFPLFFRYR